MRILAVVGALLAIIPISASAQRTTRPPLQVQVHEQGRLHSFKSGSGYTVYVVNAADVASGHLGMKKGGCGVPDFAIGNAPPCADQTMGRALRFPLAGIPPGQYRIVIGYHTPEARTAQVSIGGKFSGWVGNIVGSHAPEFGPYTVVGAPDEAVVISRAGLMPLINQIQITPAAMPRPTGGGAPRVDVPPVQSAGSPRGTVQPSPSTPAAPPPATRPPASTGRVAVCYGDQELNFAGCKGRYVYACNSGDRPAVVTYSYSDVGAAGEGSVGRRTGDVVVPAGGRTELVGSSVFSPCLSMAACIGQCRPRDHTISNVRFQ